MNDFISMLEIGETNWKEDRLKELVQNVSANWKFEINIEMWDSIESQFNLIENVRLINLENRTSPVYQFQKEIIVRIRKKQHLKR